MNLEAVKPGLAKVLHGIVAKSFNTKAAAEEYISNATDEQARHHYIEIGGVTKKHPHSSSRVVMAHIDVFFEHIFPDLQAYFGKETEANLMIVCGYSYAVSTNSYAFSPSDDKADVHSFVNGRTRSSSYGTNRSCQTHATHGLWTRKISTGMQSA